MPFGLGNPRWEWTSPQRECPANRQQPSPESMWPQQTGSPILMGLYWEFNRWGQNRNQQKNYQKSIVHQNAVFFLTFLARQLEQDSVAIERKAVDIERILLGLCEVVFEPSKPPIQIPMSQRIADHSPTFKKKRNSEEHPRGQTQIWLPRPSTSECTNRWHITCQTLLRSHCPARHFHRTQKQ